MEIIKQGKDMNIISQWIHTCKKCGCEFSFNSKDIHSDFREGNYVICPNVTCGSYIDPDVAIRIFR